MSNNNLSAREREIYDMLLEGKTAAEIAHALKINCCTVSLHKKNIYLKLDAQNRGFEFFRALNDKVEEQEEIEEREEEERRFKNKKALLFYPPRCGPLENWNAWRRFV